MRIAVKALLFVFVLFLSTPTIVATLEKSCDTSIFFGMSEEEIAHKEIKVFEENALMNNFDFFKISKIKSTVISLENRVKHNSGFLSIFSPPPNFIV